MMGKPKHTAEEAAKMQPEEGGPTLADLIRRVAKSPPAPKAAPPKVGPKNKPGRKPKNKD